MEISFLKIKQNPIELNYSKDSTSIVGEIERISRDCVKLNSTFSSEVTLICNRCGKEYKDKITYPLELILSEGRYNSNDKIDVVEFFEKKIDFDYIANSEIASIQESYNYCDSCKNSEEILEIEF